MFAVALGVRLVYPAFLSRTAFWDESGLMADSDWYLRRGREIAAGDFAGDTAAFLSPAYSGFVAMLVRCGVSGATGVKIAQAIVGAASCGLLAAAGRRIFSPAAGLIAGLGLALYGPHVFATGLVLPSVLVVFLNLAVLALAAGMPAGGWRRAAGLGAALGLAILAKPNALLLVPFLGAWLLLGFRELPPRRRLGWAAAFALAAGACIAPVTLANRAATGDLVLVSTNGGLNLWKGNGPSATGTYVQLRPSIIDLGHYLDGTPRIGAHPRADLGDLHPTELTERPVGSIGRCTIF